MAAPDDPTVALRAANRANWDDRVPIHVASEFYDLDGWLASDRRPAPWERALVGDVDGCDLVHLQCHLGTDTLAWVGEGARVTGLDFSPPAVAAANRLAERAGYADRARFVEHDALDATAVLPVGSFDVVLVTLGSLCWLPDLERWGAEVAALLRPGGRIVMHEEHPMVWAFDDDEPVAVHDYFGGPPVVDDVGATYTDGGGAGSVAHRRNYQWNHPLSTVVRSLLDRGLALDRLEEHDWTTWSRFPFLVPMAEGRWTTPPGRPRLPLSFSLVATRPG